MPNLPKALLYALCPPLAVPGSIVQFISSDDSDPTGLIVDIATAGIPGNFATDLAVNIASDVLVESLTQSAQASQAASARSAKPVSVSPSRDLEEGQLQSRKLSGQELEGRVL